MFTVTPLAATSLARVFDQPTKALRRVFDMARLGMGMITPEDAFVMTRPQPCSSMPGRTASVRRIMESTMF